MRRAAAGLAVAALTLGLTTMASADPTTPTTAPTTVPGPAPCAGSLAWCQADSPERTTARAAYRSFGWTDGCNADMRWTYLGRDLGPRVEADPDNSSAAMPDQHVYIWGPASNWCETV